VHSDTFIAEHIVQPPAQAGMRAENPYCVRYTVDGQMLARQGAMVAYRGDLTITTRGQGLGRLLKRAVTREGLALMEVEGQGEIWLADQARNVFIITLEAGDGLSVTGKSVLCFDPSLHYDIGLVKGAGMTGGGLFDCVFTGGGSIAISAHGQPLVIPVTPGQPVLVDTDAVIGWSGSLQAGIHRSESFKSVLKGGSGEAFQLTLDGEGSVIVQPSEGPLPAAKGNGGIADAVGEFLGG
jgi:uncharacterized protein (AIM24 family)